ncbi:MAG: c-type cytochrome [Alphaproteobacteria bacterium]
MKVLTVMLLAGALGLLVSAGQAHAASHGQTGGQGSGTIGKGMMGPGLMMPSMDPARGRQLFASKGCVVCHSINGVGGEDAPALDASTMTMPMNPFEFAAKMWRGAEAMVALQREELGEPIQLTGDELADIIAFVHNSQEQKKFSKTDIPPRMKSLMMHMEEGPHEEEDMHKGDQPMQ